MYKHKSKSSNIEHIDYDPQTNMLEIKFKGGSTYHYSNVDYETYVIFKDAESHGKHFVKSISGKFKHKKYEPKKKVNE